MENKQETTTANPFQELFNRQKVYFSTDITKSYEWRIDQLNRLERLLTENRDILQHAIGKDFKTAYPEQVFEVSAPMSIISFARLQLKTWMAPVEETIPKFLAASGHKGIVHREPYGVTLIIGPFNGPLLLLLDPAINALAAGNPVVLKTSNAIPNSGSMLAELIPRYFDREAVAVVQGSRDADTDLLQLPFDFIFFTGSVKVGKVVMRAAAENLVPVLLELGGQSPVIVDPTADIADAAKKIAWGATAWGGQWCTSPGYACVHESVVDLFVAETQKALVEMYGTDPKSNPDYSRIVSAKEVRRMAVLIADTNIVAGGEFDEEARYVAPTVIYPVNWSDPIMDEEIFGPILPILSYRELDDVVANVKKMAKPLSAFVFSTDDGAISQILNALSFGGGAVNQVNIHLYIGTMPFGGAGNSGIGRYYGKYGFDALSHAKSILYAPSGVAISHLFPPFTPKKVEEQNQWFKY
jgi:aldehyde dehydrogenase (NAD+)